MKFENEKYKLEIDQQEYNGDSPREWDNLGIMVCSHNRYDLGDKHDINHKDYNGWGEMKAAIIKQKKAVIILPLYLYDHSGITIATKPFHCSWDSGQIGFIYVTREKLLNEYSVKRLTKPIIDKATRVLEGEVETYDQYITGDVYSFDIENLETGKGDSCGGFYGDNFWENGMSDHISNKAIESLLPLLEKEFGARPKTE